MLSVTLRALRRNHLAVFLTFSLLWILLLENTACKDNSPAMPKLHESILAGDTATVTSIIKEGVDLNEQTSAEMEHQMKGLDQPVVVVRGSTPLHLAAMVNEVEMLNMLLAAGARWDIHNEEGQSPIHVAAISGHKDIVESLLGAGCPVDFARAADKTRSDWGETEPPGVFPELNPRKNVPGQTSLQTASSMGNLSMVEFLMKKGANVNAQTGVGMTALFAAASSGQSAITALLIRNGADVNARSVSGLTPLHVAAEIEWSGYEEGQLKILDMLLENGAVIDAKDRNGKTPLDYAADAGSRKAVEKLKNAHPEYKK